MYTDLYQVVTLLFYTTVKIKIHIINNFIFDLNFQKIHKYLHVYRRRKVW